MKALNTILTGLIFYAALFAQATDTPFRLKAEFSLDKGETIRASRLYDGGNKLLIVGAKNLQIWDVADARLLAARPHEIVPVGGFRETVYKISPDGQKIIAIDETGAGRLKEGDNKATAVVYSSETGKQAAALRRPGFAVRYVEWSKNSEVLVSLSGIEAQDTTEVAFWDGRDLSLRGSIVVKGYTWHYLSRDGKRIFIGNGGRAKIPGMQTGPGKAGVVRVYNTATGVLERELTAGGQKFDVESPYTRVSPDGRYLAAAIRKEKIFVWDLDAEENTPKYEIALEVAENYLSSIGFAGDSEFFYIAQTRTQKFYDLATGRPASEIPEMRDFKYASGRVLLTPDKKYAVLQSCGGAEVRDLGSKRQLYSFRLDCKSYSVLPPINVSTMTGYAAGNDSVAIDNSGKLLLAFRAGTGQVRRLETGKILQTLPEVKEYSWSVEGELVTAMSQNERAILVWKIE